MDKPENNNAEPGRAFYVTVVDGPAVGYLAGPYSLHTDALAAVDESRRRANDEVPESWFYAFGTAQAPEGIKTRYGPIRILPSG